MALVYIRVHTANGAAPVMGRVRGKRRKDSVKGNRLGVRDECTQPPHVSSLRRTTRASLRQAADNAAQAWAHHQGAEKSCVLASASVASGSVGLGHSCLPPAKQMDIRQRRSCTTRTSS
jgi:hypothetical protein